MNIKNFFIIWSLLAGLLFHSTGLSAAEPDWSRYNRILQDYVKPEKHYNTSLNWVDYSRLKKEPVFEKVVGQIENYPVTKLISKEEKLAFYINAYNILALKTVLNHWPVQSIKDAGSFIYPVWYRDAGKIGGKTVTLNEIEHEVLRPMGEPRIHFAIVCASVSCPDLRTEAYTAAELHRQLNDQAQRFLDNPSKGFIAENSQAHISQIFDWFRGDFKKRDSVKAFIRNHIKLPENIKLKTDLPYNWSVNGG